MDFVKNNYGALIVLIVSVLAVINDAQIIQDHPVAATVVAGALAVARIVMRAVSGVSLFSKKDK